MRHWTRILNRGVVVLNVGFTGITLAALLGMKYGDNEGSESDSVFYQWRLMAGVVWRSITFLLKQYISFFFLSFF